MVNLANRLYPRLLTINTQIGMQSAVELHRRSVAPSAPLLVVTAT